MLNGSLCDIGPTGYNLVEVDPAVSQGEFGDSRHVSLVDSALGWYVPTDHIFLFPGAQGTPNTQPIDDSGGWSNSSSSSWLVEWQARASSDATLRIYVNSGADVDFSPPDDNMLSMFLGWGSGESALTWNDRNGTNANEVVSNVMKGDVWQHSAWQKSAGSHRMDAYVDGILVNSMTPTDPPATLTQVLFANTGSSTVMREFLARSNAVYPTTPFNLGPVRFPLGDLHLRWNSMML